MTYDLNIPALERGLHLSQNGRYIIYYLCAHFGIGYTALWHLEFED